MKAKTLITILVCILVCAAPALRAQNAETDPVKLRQEIERLQKLLDAQAAANAAQTQTQGTQGSQQTPQGTQSVPQGPVSLRPVDTGKSVVTFTIGGGDKKAAPTSSDRFALKTNLLYGAGTLTPNLGFEAGLGDRTSLALTVGYNGWGNLWDFSTGPESGPGSVYKRRLDHLSAKLEFRYWLRNRFRGHFAGVHALYADYTVGGVELPPLFEKIHQHEGFVYGGGLTYGYLWPWGARWGMEFTLGAGLLVFEYDRKLITSGDEGFTVGDPYKYRETYLGPTSAGVTLIFKF